MPFTPSHAIVALPFLRTPLTPAAIASGAMTPDLSLFVRGTGLSYGFTHDAAQVIWTTLLALGFFLLWRGLLRPAVRELSPSAVTRRLPASWDRPETPEAVGAAQRPFAAALLALSLMIGVLSHIFWDLFSHEGRAGVRWLPVLSDMWGPLYGYKWVQHGSSVFGLAVLGVCGAVWLKRRRVGADVERVLPSWVRPVWFLSLPALLVAAVTVGYASFGPFTPEFTMQHLAYRALPPACAVWGVLTVALSVVIVTRRRHHDAVSAPNGRGGE